MGKEERSGGMIKLYHGGVKEIKKPFAKIGRHNLDFGPGFYLTRRLQQAKDWAMKTGRQQMERPVVNEFAFDLESVMEKCRYKNFEHYDSEWLDFIVGCRQGYDSSEMYDCIEGGVANDRVIDTVEGYINGTIDQQHALKELSKHQPNNQVCILNQEVINEYLTFINIVD